MENEKIKNECLRRMKALHLHDEGKFTCVGSFRENEEAWKSEHGGILYWLDDNEKEKVEEFEKKYNKKVYHCIKNYTEFGELLTMLFVDKKYYDEDVIDFNQSIEYKEKDGTIYLASYVENLSDEWSSEFGTVGVKSMFGGLKRVA